MSTILTLCLVVFGAGMLQTNIAIGVTILLLTIPLAAMSGCPTGEEAFIRIAGWSLLAGVIFLLWP